MTKEELIKVIENSGLTNEDKETWVKRTQTEGATKEILSELQNVFQQLIDKDFGELNIDISDTPEYKEMEATMIAQVEAAENELNKELADIEEKTKQAKQASQKQMEEVQIQATKDRISQ